MEGAPRYRLVRSIGRGGTAEVFEAFASSEHGFERRFALKHLHAELATDPAVVRSFIDEARIASRLQHMNLVSVVDAGTLDDRPFIVLEYIDGISLAALIEDGPLSPGLAAFVAAEIANGLDHAHGQGVIHRDLTPSNVLLSWTGEVKLADFGIAIAPEKRERTAAGIVKGKLGYIAPEQYRRELVDAKSDVFSLGVVLLEMVAGNNPLAEETIRRDVLAGGEVPLPPSLDGELRAIVAAATRPARERRPLARELASQCARAFAGEVEPRRALIEHLAKLRPEEVKRRSALSVLLQVEIALESSGEERRFTEVTEPGTKTDPAPEPPPRLPYRLGDRIGIGAFSEVVRAEHRQTGRLVALKMLRAELSDNDKTRLRLSRELLVLTRLRHPNLVEVIEAGTSPEGRPWIALELLTGKTLASALKAGERFPPTRVLNLARQLAAGLGALHEAGVVHRDLKPANVMLLPDEALGERVKILDFGIARILDVDGLTRLTQPGQALGTPRWMAPEQAVDAHSVDPRTDLYSLGLLLMRLTEGPAHFEGESHQVLRRRVVSDLPPIERAGNLEPVIRGLLERDPEKRPKDAGSVLAALDRITNAAPPPNPWRVPALVLLAAVIMLGTAMLSRKERAPPPPEPPIAIEAREVPLAEARPLPEEVEPPAPPPPAAPEEHVRRAPAAPAHEERWPAAEIEQIAGARGLSLSALSAHPRTRELLRARSDAEKRRDAAAFRRAESDLQAVLQELSNEQLLDAELGRFLERLGARRSQLPPDRLKEIERAYLELRSSVHPELTSAETRELAHQIDRLEASLPDQGANR